MSINLVNDVYVAFSILSATENILTMQSKMTSENAAKDAFSYIMGFCNFTC